MNRRALLRDAAGAASLLLAAPAGAQGDLPMTGDATPDLRSFDETILEFMHRRDVPGAALAVTRQGRLVYARGFGYADRDAKQTVAPDALFRIASISKPVTSAAVMTLVQAGKLDLDAPVFPRLGVALFVAPGEQPDPRLARITARHLLHHTGGWDRGKSGDPMFQSAMIAGALGAKAPASKYDILRYVAGRPLDFDPGNQEAYSNYGYLVLGCLIEKVTEQGYEEYVREHVLKPAGISRMRLGKTRLSQRADGEVHYYQSSDGEARSLWDGARVPWPYGGFCLEAMDAHGGWLASAVDLVRFAAALDFPDASRPPVMNRASRTRLYEPPAPPVARDPAGNLTAAFYGCGWMVRTIRGDERGRANYWHAGSLPGTYTLLVRRFDGLTWAVLFNQRSAAGQPPDGDIDGALHRAADAVTRWPGHDLFARFS